MKTKISVGSFTYDRLDKRLKILLSIITLIAAGLTAMVLISCSSDDPSPDPDPDPVQKGSLSATVEDENGNPYPNTVVTFSKGSETNSGTTDAEGKFSAETKGIGVYTVEMELPLSTEAISANPTTINVQANQTATVDLEIEPQPMKAHLNFGSVQLLEEIVDKDGNTPTSPNEPLFAKNIFDEPLGQLNEIKAPDGHQITLSEYQMASGNIIVHCDGNSSTIKIAFEGMIPNGTYTFWLAYLNKKRMVGENIDFANDFVNFNNPPIGPSDGSGNVALADAEGKIETTLTHGSCILTDEVALVIPVLYHINGTTFGGGHVPDAEEMVQLLVYFQ